MDNLLNAANMVNASNEEKEITEQKTYAYVHSYEKRVVNGEPIIKLTVSDSDKQPTKTIEGPTSTIIEFFEENTDGELPSEDGKHLYKVDWIKQMIPPEYVGGRPRIERGKVLRVKTIRTKK